MGFLLNFIRTSLTKKCPDGYKVGGVTKEGIVYYEKIKREGDVEKLSTNDKKRIMVRRITQEDMLQFPDIPYQLNAPIQKELREKTQPFACMDLNEYNQAIAKRDLKMVNALIVDAQKYIRLLSSDFQINIGKVAFRQYSPDYGYTKIMCEPYTFTGKISKYPISLLFMTRMDIKSYSAHGELFYEKNGEITKGSVNIWRNGTGWFFTLKKIDGVLSISEVKTTLRPDKYGRATTVYKI